MNAPDGAEATEPSKLIEPDDTSLRIRAIAEQIEPQVIAWRRRYHRYPELSGQEFRTALSIESHLDELGIPHKRVARTGIIATIAGTAEGAYYADGSPCKRIALRADIDALPVTERTGVNYASVNEGVMHACGHDCHIAMMLGAIHMINDLREHLHGEVRVLFQPAEEISDGSMAMIKAGALEGVDAIYGAHIWSEVEAGTVSCEPGQRMAHTDWFRIDIKGVSAHGSMPHKGIDAIVVGAELINAIQVLVSRDVSPFEPIVITVGEFHAGEARNILAGSAWLTGTIRTWSESMRAEVPQRMERITEDISAALGATASFTYENGNPGLENHPGCAEAARKAVVKVLGEQAVASYRGTLSGEDFSEYLNRVPGVFAFIGARNAELGCVHPQHSCYYNVDESVLVKGSMVAAQWTLDLLADNAPLTW